MASHRSTKPHFATDDRKSCPICGKRSYSLSGIHPQCAVQQADAPRQKRLAAEKRAKKLREEACKSSD